MNVLSKRLVNINLDYNMDYSHMVFEYNLIFHIINHEHTILIAIMDQISTKIGFTYRNTMTTEC